MQIASIGCKLLEPVNPSKVLSEMHPGDVLKNSRMCTGEWSYHFLFQQDLRQVESRLRPLWRDQETSNIPLRSQEQHGESYKGRIVCG